MQPGYRPVTTKPKVASRNDIHHSNDGASPCKTRFKVLASVDAPVDNRFPKIQESGVFAGAALPIVPAQPALSVGFEDRFEPVFVPFPPRAKPRVGLLGVREPDAGSRSILILPVSISLS